MKQIVFPLILVALAVGLFVSYTDPTYQSTEALQTQAAAYDDALEKAKQISAKRDQLIAQRNSFKEEDIQKLQKILPDNVDNIRLIIDVNSIAARHKLSLKDVKLGTISDTTTGRSPLAVGSSGDPVGSVTLGFTLSASYDELLAFMQDLEHSLRVIDVEDLAFNVVTTNKNDYSFLIRTYWLH